MQRLITVTALDGDHRLERLLRRNNG